jgi:toxin YoeB
MEQFEQHVNFLIDVAPAAKDDLNKHLKAGNKATTKRIERMFLELAKTPFIGIGNPEALKHGLTGYWSRKINKKDRLLYRVDNEQKIVFVASAMGHYKQH